MALDESDRLSLLALIVAIVALVVSAWQLAQQLFATAADGKRFCQASVMGVWARKTRLSWRWSQIRFETKYTTPDIRLTSGISRGALHGSETAHQQPGIWYRLPIIGWLVEVSLGPSSDWDGFFEVTSNRTDVPLELRRTRLSDDAGLVKSSAEKLSLWFLDWWDGSYRADSPEVVSWPKLLERLYTNQVHAVQKLPRQQQNGLANDTKTAEQGKTEQSLIPCADLSDAERGRGEDRVIVRLVERSWDLVPSDVVRPLARSTIGSVVAMAHRLGMSWIGEFDPNQGQMNAFGCGHTITSESIRGLGVVLQYDYRKESNKIRNALGSRRGLRYGEFLAPTEAADKLHCGIVPIDIDAVPFGSDISDLHLIEAGRRFDMPGLISRLDLSSADADILRDSKNQNNQYGTPLKAFKHAIEDAVSMICPIPVLPNSQARWIVWPFRTMRQPFTPTRHESGIEKLTALLSSYMTSHPQNARIMTSRAGKVLEPLDSSPLQYLEELLNALTYITQHRNTSKAQGQQTLCGIYKRIQEIHRRTSDVFAKIEYPKPKDDDESEIPSFLMVIAAAHVTMAIKHGERAENSASAKDDQLPDGSKATENENRAHFIETLAELYDQDVRGALPDDLVPRTVRKHIRRAGYSNVLEPGVIPALWWTLVVRSVCWWLSVQIRLPDTQIPSFWYDSQMPVFIT